VHAALWLTYCFLAVLYLLAVDLVVAGLPQFSIMSDNSKQETIAASVPSLWTPWLFMALYTDEDDFVPEAIDAVCPAPALPAITQCLMHMVRDVDGGKQANVAFDLAFAGALVFLAWALYRGLQRAIQRRMQHRILLGTMGAVPTILAILSESADPAMNARQGDADARLGGEDGGGEDGNDRVAREEVLPGGVGLQGAEAARGWAAIRGAEMQGGVRECAATALVHVATGSDAAAAGLVSVPAVQQLIALMASPAPGAGAGVGNPLGEDRGFYVPGGAARESVTQAVHELLLGRDPTAVLLAVVRTLGQTGSNAADLRLQTLQALAAVLPKQCSCRVRQAVCKTGLVGALVAVVWGGGALGPPVGLDGGEAEAGEEGQEARRKGGILAANLLVRLATQLEWETEHTPLFYDIVARLCTAIIEDPASPRARRSAVLLAVLANTLVCTLAYMRLYEPQAEHMPLRLEQVRLDLRRVTAEHAAHTRHSTSLLQVKAQSLVTIAAPALCALIVSPQAAREARAAAALCLATLGGQRPSLRLPHQVPEALSAMLTELDQPASHVADALAALAWVHAVDRVLPDLGVAERLVAMASRGDGEVRAAAVAAIDTLARHRRSFRALCCSVDATDVLQQLEDGDGPASLRDAARAGLASLRRSVADDLAAACSSTGYFCLVAFCFFVQLGGVHAVLDILEVASDILHVLSRITAVRARLAAPSLLAILSDFMVHDPIALLLVVLLAAVIPAAAVVLYARQCLTSSDKVNALPGKRYLYCSHRSWLLGLQLVQVDARPDKDPPPLADPKGWLARAQQILRQRLWGDRVAGTPREFRYLVGDVAGDGPLRHRVREGDELLAIDGVALARLDLAALAAACHGQPRLSLAQHAAAAASRMLGLSGAPRMGRGSHVTLTLLLVKRDGRRQRRDLVVVRGGGFPQDGAPEAAGDAEVLAYGLGRRAEPAGALAAARAGEDRGAGARLWGAFRAMWPAPEEAQQRAGRDDKKDDDKRMVQGLFARFQPRAWRGVGFPGEVSVAGGSNALATAAGGSSATPIEDEPVCRICQCTEAEAAEQGRLFTPCRCKGTMRFIHQGCLETWRKMSSNAASSTHCDQCAYAYRIQKKGVASFISARGVVCAAALVFFCLGIFLAGFVVRWVRIAWDAPAGMKGGDVETAMEEAMGKVMSLDHLWENWWEHVQWGCIGIGILGFSTLVSLPVQPPERQRTREAPCCRPLSPPQRAGHSAANARVWFHRLPSESVPRPRSWRLVRQRCTWHRCCRRAPSLSVSLLQARKLRCQSHRAPLWHSDPPCRRTRVDGIVARASVAQPIGLRRYQEVVRCLPTTVHLLLYPTYIGVNCFPHTIICYLAYSHLDPPSSRPDVSRLRALLCTSTCGHFLPLAYSFWSLSSSGAGATREGQGFHSPLCGLSFAGGGSSSCFTSSSSTSSSCISSKCSAAMRRSLTMVQIQKKKAITLPGFLNSAASSGFLLSYS